MPNPSAVVAALDRHVSSRVTGLQRTALLVLVGLEHYMPFACLAAVCVVRIQTWTLATSRNIDPDHAGVCNAMHDNLVPPSIDPASTASDAYMHVQCSRQTDRPPSRSW